MGFILEEGFPISDLKRILQSIHDTCTEADVATITGDTKVVERGALDKFVVNSSGIGIRSEALEKNLAMVKKYCDCIYLAFLDRLLCCIIEESMLIWLTPTQPTLEDFYTYIVRSGIMLQSRTDKFKRWGINMFIR